MVGGRPEAGISSQLLRHYDKPGLGIDPDPEIVKRYQV
jgi:L-alanine-DL-glutamate epimerase-like enolase superfamily enzyme